MLVFADPVPRPHPYAPRLHDRGVALLPVWAIEYSVLRQPARAFVSAMRPGPDPKVAGVTHYGAHALRYMLPTALAGGVAGGVGALAGGGLGCVSVAGAASAAGGSVLAGAGGALAGGALAGVLAGSAAGGAGAMLSGYALAWYRRYRWRDLGELRRRESRDNQEWKVRRHWISEVERVLEWQEPPRLRRQRPRHWRQGLRAAWASRARLPTCTADTGGAQGGLSHAVDGVAPRSQPELAGREADRMRRALSGATRCAQAAAQEARSLRGFVGSPVICKCITY